MATGKVKSFDQKKGFGFITHDGGGRDVFFHYSVGAFPVTIIVGQLVEFEIENGSKGPQAVNMKIM